MRMLDQDQIRLQQKLNTVLEYRKAERLRKKLRNEKPDKVIKS